MVKFKIFINIISIVCLALILVILYMYNNDKKNKITRYLNKMMFDEKNEIFDYCKKYGFIKINKNSQNKMTEKGINFLITQQSATIGFYALIIALISLVASMFSMWCMN